MNLEQLTKHQIVLLTLLVSFVTSIATGIVTVSLMDQAPAGVTRVVNQIVEHTVEKVIPATQSAAAAASTEKTVVVKDDDLIASSIAKVQKSMIRVTLPGSNQLLSRGIIIDATGTALVDRNALAAASSDKFDAILPSGERVTASLQATTSTSSPLAVLNLAVGTSTDFVPATLADISKLSLGQSVVRIGGKGADMVGSGVVAMLPTSDAPNLIMSSVSSATPGSVLINIFGEVIGLTTAASALVGDTAYTIASLPQTSTPAASSSETPSP